MCRVLLLRFVLCKSNQIRIVYKSDALAFNLFPGVQSLLHQVSFVKFLKLQENFPKLASLLNSLQRNSVARYYLVVQLIEIGRQSLSHDTKICDLSQKHYR